MQPDGSSKNGRRVWARFTAAAGLSVLLCAAGFVSARASSYDYPVADPLLATVVGTLPEDTAEIPAKFDASTRRLHLFPDRDVPSIFWNQGAFRYGFSRREGPAPLIFVLAGTGSSYRADKVVFLQRLLWAHGFHVVTLSSPTHPDFMLTASTSGMPGLTRADTDDLYAAMKAIVADLRADGVEMTGFHMTGYSLGATEAAFLAERDARERDFTFERVLMINPAVNLYTSALILDRMFVSGLPDGAETVERMVTGLLDEITTYVHSATRGPLDAELLYHIADEKRPDARQLEGLIAVVFRLAAANMVFVADVLHGGGHVLPEDKRLTVSTSLTPYFKQAVRWPFERYVDDLLVPFWKVRRPGADKDALIAEASLAHIRSFLQTADNVAVVTNADDPILGDGDLDLLQRTFGRRAKVYPRGGHCGNFKYKTNIAWLLEYFEVQPAETASATGEGGVR